MKEGVEGGGEFRARPILLANDFAGDAAVAADQIGFGNHHRAIVGANFSVVVAIGGKVDAVFLKEFLIGGGIVIPANAQNRPALGRNALLKRIQ